MKLSTVSKNTRGVAFLLLFSVANLLFMHYYIFLNHFIEDIMLSYAFGINLMTVFFDVSVVLLLFLLLFWGRMKLSLIMTFGITFMWSFANVFYVRFFNQYLSLSAIGQAENLTDQAVVNSMMAGFQLTDLYYALSLMLFVVVCCRIGTITSNRSLLLKLLLTPVVSFASIFLIYSAYHFMKSETRHNNMLYASRIRGLFFAGARNSFPNMTRFLTGSIRIVGGEIYDLYHVVVLTPQQRETIAAEAVDLSHRVTGHQPNPRIKNVVLIILESFLSSPIDLRVDGKEITPFMNALKRDSNTYYNGHVIPNITMGESGDGQFIYMTGILPLRDKLTVGEAKSASFPAFPRLLAKQYGTSYTEIVMPSPPQVWEQMQMNIVYGIENMFCNRNVLGNVVDYLNDEQVFKLAMNTPAPRRQPFFSMVLSYSTHQPYRTPVDNSLTINAPSLSDAYRNYLIACHYADMWLKRYIDYLKQENVFDNTLIVITADHHAHLDALNMGNKVKKELPLFIINGNVDNTMAWTGDMNQLDIYTTLLDILGIESSWHGLGHTVLTPNYQNSLTEKAWDLSELIIKGDFFRSNK